MENTVLSLLRGGRTLSVKAIADALGTSTEMVEAMLVRYEQLGYVKKNAACTSACGGACKTCKMGSSGNPNTAPVVFWELASGSNPTK